MLKQSFDPNTFLKSLSPEQRLELTALVSTKPLKHTRASFTKTIYKRRPKFAPKVCVFASPKVPPTQTKVDPIPFLYYCGKCKRRLWNHEELNAHSIDNHPHFPFFIKWPLHIASKIILKEQMTGLQGVQFKKALQDRGF